jgi:hypothetical protein
VRRAAAFVGLTVSFFAACGGSVDATGSSDAGD